MAVMIGDAAVTMLPVAEERVARPRLKKIKYAEKPRIPERKNHSTSFLQKGFLILHALPMIRRTMAAIKHLMKHSDEEDISSPMTLVKGKPEPHKSTVKKANAFTFMILFISIAPSKKTTSGKFDSKA